MKAAPKKAAPQKWSEKKSSEVVRAPKISLQRGQHFIEFHKEGDCRVPEGASIKQNV